MGEPTPKNVTVVPNKRGKDEDQDNGRAKATYCHSSAVNKK
jgi:hypothetical protein